MEVEGAKVKRFFIFANLFAVSNQQKNDEGF
jgi:hypothetical protein